MNFMRTNIFDRLSFLSLFLVVVLLPVFCLPFTNIPVEISKGLLFVFGLTVCIVFWAIARFIDGKIVFPKSWLLLSGLGIVFVFLLSALFSEGREVSLFGIMLDVGSFYFIFGSFILMLMSSIVFRTPKRAKIVLFGVILSSVFVLIFQSIHLFMPTILSLGILTSKTDNILGSWNALGLFAGFASLMFLLVIEFFPVSKIEKILLEVFTLLSILFIAVVNFPLVWILLGISSLVIFVYKVSTTLQVNQDEKEKKHFPMISFVVMIVSLLFFISGNFFGNIISNRLQISNPEVSLSLGATASITKAVLVKNPLLGVGPNKFGEMWSMYKPASINNTQFWNTSFGSGSGLLPTLTATTGGLGILSWVIFLVLFLYVGTKSVFSSIKNRINWEMVAFFVLSIFLFVSSFFYFSGTVMFLLAFVFTGVFIGLAHSLSEKEISISFLNDHRKSFFSILLLVLLVIFSVTISFKYVERFVSISYFGKALSASNISDAENSMSKALSLYLNDLYFRTYSQIYLAKVNSLVGKGSELSEVDKTDLQTSFDQAKSGAQMATNYNPLNYSNFQLLGSVYQVAGTLGVKDSFTEALKAFQSASKLNPLNPSLKVAMAGVLLADGKTEEAKNYANEALALKADYVDVFVVLSQISKSEGNNSEAISYAQKALSFAPDDKDLIKYVDSLKNSTSKASSETIIDKPKQ